MIPRQGDANVFEGPILMVSEKKPAQDGVSMLLSLLLIVMMMMMMMMVMRTLLR
jgi:hypothetical protein